MLAALLLSLPAQAQQWFSLSGRDSPRDGTLVEVDLETVRLREGAGEAVIRVTHDVLQPHPAGFGYRSFVATAQIDCGRNLVTLASAAYFALMQGQGIRMGADSSGRQGGMPPRLITSIPQPMRAALLKAACAPPSSPAQN